MIVYAVTNLGSKKMARIPHLLMGLLLLSCLGSISDAKYAKYRDPNQPLNARIKDLLKRMTLEEKIGQMVQIDRTVASSEVLKKYFIGSVLSGGGSVPAKQASPETWIDMVNDFQKGSLSTRLGIPMIYGIDAVHGHNNVYKATVFPHNIGLGATRLNQALDSFFMQQQRVINKLEGSGELDLKDLISKENLIYFGLTKPTPVVPTDTNAKGVYIYWSSDDYQLRMTKHL